MCKFIWNKQKWARIPRVKTRNWLIVSVLSGTLLLGSSAVKALEVAEAISIEGIADYRPDYDKPEIELENIEQGLDIEVKYLLQTRPSNSKVALLLKFGHMYTIGAGSNVRVEEPIGSKISFALVERGIIRAVTSRSGSIRFVTNTGEAEASAKKSGYIVGCGPTVKRSQGTCIFVGLYGQSEVKSFAYPSQPVILERQFYTEVQPGKPPAPNPPKKLSDDEFQEYIDMTTIVGTGNQNDRLELTSFDELIPGYPLPPQWPQKEPQTKIPDVPLADFEPLPLPPLPPLPAPTLPSP